MTLHLSQGQVLRLQDVLYVPNLKKNLVYISAMEDKGFNVAFIDGKVRIWKKSFKEAITIGFRVDTLYQVGGSPLGAMTCDTTRQTDNGIEYETNEFKNFCREAGIKRETTTVYTPEHNDVVEQKNRTIVEATHAMLCD